MNRETEGVLAMRAERHRLPVRVTLGRDLWAESRLFVETVEARTIRLDGRVLRADDD